MTFTRALATNNYGPAKFIVDGTTTANGTHSTIAAALTSSSSGDTIFIRPGTYTENLTLKAGVNLTAFGSDSSQNGTGKVIIAGTCTLTTAGSVSISGIQLQTNSAALLAVTGSAASIVNLENCYLNMTNNTGITFSTSSGSGAIYIRNCSGNLGTTGIAIFSHSSAGTLNFYSSDFGNPGTSTTANTASAGTLILLKTAIMNPVTTSGSAIFTCQHSILDSSVQNVIATTQGGSGNSNILFTHVSSGSASAISISNTTGIYLCNIASSNTNAITGAGTIQYNGLTFSGSSSTINTTTQTISGTLKGSTTTAPTGGMLGEQIRSLLAFASAVTLSNSAAANITSISLTAGIWDVSCISAFSGNGGSVTGTFFEGSISTTSATRGTISDSSSFIPYPPITGNADVAVSVPAFRITLTSTTTVYMVGFAIFSVGTVKAYGRISATRVG